jgi:hypothetical protein
MKAWLERLKARWEIKSNLQLALVFIVFALTGSLSLKVSRPVLEWAGITDELRPWVRIPLRIIAILPVYQVMLLLIGGLFGQFRFFLNLQKKWLHIGQRKRT